MIKRIILLSVLMLGAVSVFANDAASSIASAQVTAGTERAVASVNAGEVQSPAIDCSNGNQGTNEKMIDGVKYVKDASGNWGPAVRN